MKILLFWLNLYLTGICQSKTWQPTSHYLTWNDFQGKRDLSSIYNAGSQLEIIHGFEYLSDTIIINVITNFDQCNSWTASNDSLLLVHEQGHYDLAEIYARMFRRRIMQLKYKGIVQMLEDVQKEQDLIYNEMNKEEERYDVETGHSFISVKQQNWNEKISQELNRLNDYESSKCLLKKQP